MKKFKTNKDRSEEVKNRGKLIVESFQETFNKIKRIDESIDNGIELITKQINSSLPEQITFEQQKEVMAKATPMIKNALKEYLASIGVNIPEKFFNIGTLYWLYTRKSDHNNPSGGFVPWVKDKDGNQLLFKAEYEWMGKHVKDILNELMKLSKKYDFDADNDYSPESSTRGGSRIVDDLRYDSTGKYFLSEEAFECDRHNNFVYVGTKNDSEVKTTLMVPIKFEGDNFELGSYDEIGEFYYSSFRIGRVAMTENNEKVQLSDEDYLSISNMIEDDLEDDSPENKDGDIQWDTVITVRGHDRDATAQIKDGFRMAMRFCYLN